MSWSFLLDELRDDPLAIGYAGMDDQQRMDSLEDDSARPAPDLIQIEAAQLYDAIDRVEYTALSASQQDRVKIILSLGRINTSQGTQARDEILEIFPPGGDTITALTTLITNRTQSRAQELRIGSLNLVLMANARAALGG